MSIESLRKERGLSRRDVALKLGVTEQTVFNAERKGQMSVNLLNKLAELYGCATDHILGREQAPTPTHTSITHLADGDE
jgi:transcriptional regulator with XRE-family HTH domain